MHDTVALHSFYSLVLYLADSGKARGCSTNTFIIKRFADSLDAHLVKISLRRRHAQTAKNCASSHTTNYIDISSEIWILRGI